jgi:pimeloyl-ACP methyl ester carboxylesterase
MQFEEVSFAVTDGTILRGHHYRAKGSAGAAPVIVMAHGFGGIIALSLAPFAQAFADAGLNVLLYDHRNFGISDGAIRQEVEPFRQLDDWRDAITFAQSLPGVDPERVGVWGSSFSGGHVMVLGATDRRVKCVACQVPFISGSQTAARSVRPDFVGMSRKMFAHDRAERLKGAEPIRIPIVSDDPGVPAALAGKDAYDWTIASTKDIPDFRNDVTLRSIEAAGAYEPGTYARMITPTPFLMIVGLRDQLTVPDVALSCYAEALEPKKLVLVDGGHMDPYDVKFEEASSAARDWFVQHLSAGAASNGQPKP